MQYCIKVYSYLNFFQKLPFEEILSGYYKLDEWKPELIVEILSYLRPDNLMIWILDKQSEKKAVLEEPWYGIKYFVEPIPKEVLEVRKKLK